MVDGCKNEKNIGIICSSLTTPGVNVAVFRALMGAIEQNGYLENTFVIHDVFNIHDTIPMIERKGDGAAMVRKILNVFYWDQYGQKWCDDGDKLLDPSNAMKATDTSYEEKRVMSDLDKMRKNESLYGRFVHGLDVTYKDGVYETGADLALGRTLYEMRTSTIAEPNTRPTIQNVRLLVKSTYPKDRLLKNAWWYAYLTRLPACMAGRLRQFVGTCWFHSTLNHLFLPPGLKPLLVRAFEAEVERDGNAMEKYAAIFNACPSTNISLRDFLLSYIYGLLILKKYVRPEDGNAAGAMASRVKAEMTNKLFDPTGGEGHNPSNATAFVLKTLFPETSLGIRINSSTIPKHLTEGTFLVHEAYTRMDTDGKKTWGMLMYGNIYGNYQFNTYDGDKSTILFLDKKPDDVVRFDQVMQSSTYDVLLIRAYYMNGQSIVPCKPPLPLEVFFGTNGIKYTLQSGIISTANNEHAISCFICDGKGYIYDANDIMARVDWWKEKLGEQWKNYMRAKFHRYDNVPDYVRTFDGFYHLIYVRSP